MGTDGPKIESSRIALVIAGGDPPPPDLLAVLPPPVITVAADSGINHANALDLMVDVLVGDLDSADEESVRWATERGASVEVHPTNKNQTDLELALERVARSASELDVDELVVVGIGGGRIDHWLANLLALAGPITASLDTSAYAGRSRVTVVRGRRTLRGAVGEVVTLLPLGGPVHGVTTTGLEYPLRNETLEAGSSRGVSNVFTEVAAAEVRVSSGTLLAIQPDYLTSGEGAPGRE